MVDSGSDTPVFWQKQFKRGDRFSVRFDFRCRLGTNLYEIQAAISYEDKPDYTAQRILHWVDEAAFFHVAIKREENFFGGVFDLEMKADW
jgi:lipopolysaccharide transport system ATP-binding protein